VGTYQLGRRLVAASGIVEAHLGSCEGQWFVLSRLSPPWTQDATFLERFGAQAQALSMVRTEEVAPVVEFGAGGDGFWFAEATGDGEPLRALMTSKSGQLSVDEAIAIIERLAQGLVGLHAAGLTHGDVSASSVFVGSDGRAQLLHAGLAVVAGAHASRGPARSEPHAVAPEQLKGLPGPSTDVFRLGLLLLEMLTGRSLFVAQDPLQVLGHAQRYQGLPAAVLQGVPEQVGSVLAWMMHLEPTQRPPADHVVNALQMASSSLGLSPGAGAISTAFRRLMSDRQPPMAARTTELRLTPPRPVNPPPSVPRPSAPSAPVGSVIGRIGTRRLSADALETVKSEDAFAKAPAPSPPNRAALIEPQLGEQLVRSGALGAAQVSEAQARAVMLNLSLADALVIDGVLEEDVVTEALATVTRTTFVSSAQLAQLTAANAPLTSLSQADAERLVAVPLTVKGQGLVVAVADPLEPGVLEAVRAAAPTMTVHLVRAGARALQDTLARLFGAPDGDPDSWLERGPTPGRASVSGITTLTADVALEVPEDGGALELEGRPAARARSVTVSGLDEGQTKLVEVLLQGFGDAGQDAIALVQLAGEVARRLNASTQDIDKTRFVTAAVAAVNLLERKPPFAVATSAALDQHLGALALPVKGAVPALFGPLKSMPDDLVGLAVVTTFAFAATGHSSRPTPWQPVIAALRTRRFPTLALEALGRALER
jgi:serine/threonine protein kinase